MCNRHKFDYKQGRNGVFGLDKSRRRWYNRPWATDRPKGRPYGAVAFPVAVDSHGKVSFHILKPFPKFHTEGR